MIPSKPLFQEYAEFILPDLVCPHCRSEAIGSGDQIAGDDDEGGFHSMALCRDCGGKWKILYEVRPVKISIESEEKP